MSTRWARVARGGFTAGFATLVAAVFHVASGGPSPSVLAVVITMAFALMLCVALTGRRVALWRQSVSVGASQFLFHALFVLGQGSATLSSGSAGHVHAGTTIAFSTTGAGAANLAHAGHVMWLGHALALIVTVAALRYGEWALRGVARLTGLILSRALPLAAVPAPRAHLPVVSCEVVRDARRHILQSPLSHRGPPAA